jgi:hypothetical protein
MMPWTDSLTGKQCADPIPAKPKPQAPDWHEHKVRPTGETDVDGAQPYEVYSDALGHIGSGKVKL